MDLEDTELSDIRNGALTIEDAYGNVENRLKAGCG
jgi:hypothetical protein